MFVIVHMSIKSRRHLTGSLWENKRARCYFWLPSSHSVIQNVDKRDLDDKGCWYGSIRELQTMLCTIPMMCFHYPHAQSSNIKVHFQPIGYNITRCKFPSLHIGLIGVAIIQCYLFACTLERGMTILLSSRSTWMGLFCNQNIGVACLMTQIHRKQFIVPKMFSGLRQTFILLYQVLGEDVHRIIAGFVVFLWFGIPTKFMKSCAQLIGLSSQYIQRWKVYII